MSPDWQAFWISWRFDPGLSLSLVLAAILYLRGWMRLRNRGARQFTPGQPVAFFAGLIVIALALQSPLEVFSGLLLQVHMLQHLLLMFIAPPLLWFAAPELPLLVGLPRGLRRQVAVPLLRDEGVRMLGRALTNPIVAWLLFVLTAWIWHLPGLYNRALTSNSWHVAEHASFLTAALCFWHVVVAPFPHTRRTSRWVVLPYLLLAGLQGTALSALLTFSDRVLYPTTRQYPGLWNMTALDDQAIAGAIMWCGGSFVYLLAPLLGRRRNLECPAGARRRWARQGNDWQRALACGHSSQRNARRTCGRKNIALGSARGPRNRHAASPGSDTPHTADNPAAHRRIDRTRWRAGPCDFSDQPRRCAPLDPLARRLGVRFAGGR